MIVRATRLVSRGKHQTGLNQPLKSIWPQQHIFVRCCLYGTVVIKIPQIKNSFDLTSGGAPTRENTENNKFTDVMC